LHLDLSLQVLCAFAYFCVRFFAFLEKLVTLGRDVGLPGAQPGRVGEDLQVEGASGFYLYSEESPCAFIFLAEFSSLQPIT